MNQYGVYFDLNGTTYRLPTNPESIEITISQSVEKYEVLKAGQIAVPAHMELKKYSFECEFPHTALYYIETPGDFKAADFYLNLFEKWRNDRVPVRFVVSNETVHDIDTLVLIEELTVKENAGEEGDKYISFKLLEYKKYGKRIAELKSEAKTATVKESPKDEVNPKGSGTYTVVAGDCLWSIAKKYYGNGSKYTKIYNANRDKIKNPSLIYPGQQLTIPR